MWDPAIVTTNNGTVLSIRATNYYKALGGKEIQISRTFEQEEEAVHYFISCAMSFCSGTFDMFIGNIKAFADNVFNMKFSYYEKHRIEFIDNYHKCIDLKKEYDSPSSSYWKKCELLTGNIETLFYCVPKQNVAQFEKFKTMLSDMLRSASQIKRALGDILDFEQPFEKITEQNINELIKEVA